MLTEQLELDAGPALSTVDQVDKALRRVAQSFRVELNDALDTLQRPLQVDVDADTAGLASEVTGAVDAADTQVTVTGDASDLTGDVTAAVDAGDTQVSVTGDASQLTGAVTAAVDAADTEVTVTADTSALAVATGDANGLGLSLTNIRTAVAALAGGAVISAAGAGLVSFLSSAGDAASNLEESTTKSQAVFRSFAGDVQDFSEEAATSLGLSEQAALEATGTFGNLFTALGLSREEAARLSPEIVTLAGDLASFNNLDIGGEEGTLAKLRSGLVGEIEPLRQLGVSFNAAQVEARALEERLPGVTGAITEQEKVTARLSLIMDQTANSQGDFARTSEGLANQQRILEGEIGNLLATLGTGLLPTFKEGVTAARDFVPALEVLGGAVVGVVNAFAPFARLVATELSSSIQGLGPELDDLVTAMEGLSDTAGPIVAGLVGIAVDGIGPLVDGLTAATTALDDFLALATEIPGLDFRTAEIGEDARGAGEGLDILGFAAEGTTRSLVGLSTLGLSEILPLIRTTDEGARSAADAIAEIQGEADRFRSSQLIPEETISNTQQWVIDLNEAVEATTALLDTSGQFSVIGSSVADAEALASEKLSALRESFEEAGRSTDDLPEKAEANLAEFNEVMRRELEATVNFVTNINTLIARGADETAAIFLQQGPAAAGLLAETVALNDEALAEQEANNAQTKAVQDIALAQLSRHAQEMALQAELAKQGVNVNLAELGNVDIEATFALLQSGTASQLDILESIGRTGGDEVGVGIGEGMSNGMARMASAVAFAARDLARAAIGSARFELGIFSPSRVFHEIGAEAGAGLILGIESQITNAAAAAAALARAAAGAASEVTAGTPFVRFEDNSVATPGDPGFQRFNEQFAGGTSLTVQSLRVEVPPGTENPRQFGAEVGEGIAESLVAALDAAGRNVAGVVAAA